MFNPYIAFSGKLFNALDYSTDLIYIHWYIEGITKLS